MGSFLLLLDDCSMVSILLLLFLLLLILTLSLELIDGILGTVGDEIATVVEAGPFGLSIVDVEDTSGIEHVAAETPLAGDITWCRYIILFIPRVEVFPILRVLEVDQGGEEQDHIPPFVHDGRSAVGAADFAGKLVDAGLFGAFVPAEIMVAVGKIDVVFVEDCCPLKRGAYKLSHYNGW